MLRIVQNVKRNNEHSVQSNRINNCNKTFYKNRINHVFRLCVEINCKKNLLHHSAKSTDARKFYVYAKVHRSNIMN